MDHVDLRPGTRVNVVLPDGDPDVAYEAAVRSVSHDAVRLTMPRREGEFLPVGAGEEVTLFASVQGQVYRIATRVRLVEVSPAEGLVVEPPAEAEKSERRSYYRLITRIVPTYIAVVGRDGSETPLLDTTILDLSGGGMQMQSLSQPDPGTRLRVVFGLHGDPVEMDTCVEVLCVRAPVRGGRYHRVHGRFVDLPRADVERLIRYVTRQQIEMRRKGRL